jgi:uncharacterized repeat protein (TIGR01451 family)
VASVPPEIKLAAATEDDFGQPPPLDPTAAPRSSRGLDFRRAGEMTKEPEGTPPGRATASDEPAVISFTPDDTPRLSVEDTPPSRLETPLLLPVPEADDWDRKPDENEFGDEPAIRQVGGATPPQAIDEADPFADSAPPDMPATRSPRPALAAPVQDEDPFDPFGGEPEPLPKRTPSPAADSAPRLKTTEENLTVDPEPLPAETPEPERPRPRPPLPTDLDAFDPFPDEAPPRRGPARLPIEIDDATEPETPRRQPEPLPELEPEPAAPPANRLESRSRLPDPRNNPPARSADPQPLSDVLIGDGELSASVPRGVQEPRLSIEKQAPPRAVIGQPLIYSVVIRNIGQSIASQVMVEDRIPRGTRLVGTAPRAELIDKRLTWKLGDIKPGDEKKIAIKVIPEEEGAIGSVARVTFVSEIAAEIVVTAPKLKLDVIGPQEVKVGSTAELVFSLSNPGNGDATNVVIRSVIPDGFQHPAGSDLEYALGTLAPKESREVRLEVTAVKPGRAVHKAVVSADGNVGTESQTPVEVIGEQLLLTRSGHNRVYLGRQAVYTNTVTNEGQRPINRVQIVESVPAGFDFVEASDNGRYDAGQRTVTWSVGPIAAGDKVDVSTTLVAKSLGEFSSEISAQGPTGATASVKPTIAIDGFPSLAVEPLGDQRLVAIGEQVTSRIQLRNKGTAPAKNVGLTITLPPELRLVSAKGPGRHRQEAGRVIFDPVEELLASGAAEFLLVFEAQSAGDSRLEMQISADHLRRPVRHEEAVQIVGN